MNRRAIIPVFLPRAGCPQPPCVFCNQELLTDLDEIKRSIFLLRFQEHHSIREISEIMRCPEGTVKSRLFHTARYLSGRLREYKEI